MIIYSATIKDFVNHCRQCGEQSIQNQIAKGMRYNGISGFGDSQINAWENSLPVVANSLDVSDLDKDVDVAIEYKVRPTAKRIDFVVYGKNDESKKNVVVIELKQWSRVSKTGKKDYVHTFGGDGEKDYWHPSYQARNYANIMLNFNEYIQKNDVNVEACSFLHNMDKRNSILLSDESVYPIVKESPVFYKDDEKKLAEFISKHVKHKDANLLYEIENSRIVPSRHLSGMLSSALKGNDFFTYDDDQANSVAEIVMAVKDAIYYNEKKVIIIKGGPGTGKSIVALNAMGQLISPKDGSKPLNAIYMTTNRAPRTLYSEELVKDDFKKTVLKSLFKYPTSSAKSAENTFDCILVDEAHRVFDYKTGVGLKSGTHMLEEIIRSSRVTVFFVDNDQAVTSLDYATEEIIKETARKMHIRSMSGDDLVLSSQFRVTGGEEYISFVKTFLGYEKKIDFYRTSNLYDLKVFDNANNMFEALKEKDEYYKNMYNQQEPGREHSGKCRMVAGYTYEWNSKDLPEDSEVYDVILDNGEFAKKWNLNRTDYSWLNDPDSINEVGCIHTSQGLDMNYCGVIIGKDLRYENGDLVFDKTKNAKSDKSSGISKADDELARRLIRNTYNVLLTRGMAGTYIYCEDEGLREYLKTLIKH